MIMYLMLGAWVFFRKKCFTETLINFGLKERKSCLFFAKQNKPAAPLPTEYRETSARRKHINFDRGARFLLLLFLNLKICSLDNLGNTK